MHEYDYKTTVQNSLTAGAGRGVFAAQAIPDTAIIMIDYNFPVHLPDEAVEAHKASGLYWLMFKDRHDRPNRWAVALGRSSLLNHGEEPNVKVEQSDEGGLTFVIALRNIESGEELTMRYFNAEEYDGLR